MAKKNNKRTVTAAAAAPAAPATWQQAYGTRLTPSRDGECLLCEHGSEVLRFPEHTGARERKVVTDALTRQAPAPGGRWTYDGHDALRRDGKTALLVKGWGHLIGRGQKGLALDADRAQLLRAAFAKDMAARLNGNAKKKENRQ